MSGPSGTLFDQSMGDVKGGNVDFHEDGSSHHTVYGDGMHYSWDQDRDGNVSNGHGTDDGTSKGDPDRHW